MSNRHAARVAAACAEPFLSPSHQGLLTATEAEQMALESAFESVMIDLQAAINHHIAAEMTVRRLGPISTSTQADGRLLMLQASLLESRSALFDKVAHARAEMQSVANALEYPLARLRDESSWEQEPAISPTVQHDGLPSRMRYDIDHLGEQTLSDLPF